LLGTVAYLLVMASAGYYLRYYGGEWGAIAQIVFLVGAFLLLALVLFSGHIRARVRIFISKNFFSNAYDYREEWLRFIATLSDSEAGLSLEQRVIQALAQVVESPGGILWIREPTGRFAWRASLDAEDIAIPAIDADDPVVGFLERREWIVNLQEMAAMPEVYQGFSKPLWLERHANAWLLIPLFHQGKKMDGMVLLTRTRSPFAWNWEVIDMLKTTSRLATSYLALEYAAKDLAEAQQFDGFNRLSAFIIHDLKNLVAQLSLVVSNAEKHQDNPEFMRDAIQTVNHAVGKMNALMTQLRNSSSAVTTAKFDLGTLLHEVAEARKKQQPPPQCELEKNPLLVSANRSRLAAALEHVIQNGQEAAGKQGRVVVRLRAGDKRTACVEVEDNGCGMDDHFIRTRLFKPFDTTKGLTGMGIGAYESREYVRSLGGELSVQSEPGKGSLFCFQIPLAETNLPFH
jgi:putative PEP-CTERM system histidine kinase